VPSAVLVALTDEESRRRGDASPPRCAPRHPDRGRREAPQKFGKQIRYAERRGIPFVWFPDEARRPPGQGHPHRRAGRRRPATWTPPAEDLRPQVSTTDIQGAAVLIRTHDAGTLRAEHVGQTVTLAGWVARRRDHGGVAFIDLREASGVVQVVSATRRSRTPAQRVLPQGHRRGDPAPEGNANPNLPTGEIEVVADRRRGAQRRAPLPFPIDDHVEVGEEARLKHRYLDLRRSGPARAPAAQRGQQGRPRRAARHGFVEIETPTLTRSTPEGARDFLVPAGCSPGSWYALPQSRSCSSSC
jgi:hypothetical protein